MLARKRLLSCLLFLLLNNYVVTGQAVFQSGLLPRINLSTKLPGKYSLQNMVETRQIILDNSLEDPVSYHYVLTDIAALVSYKLAADQSVNVGYTLRLRDQKYIHRYMQQFNIIMNQENFRLGHRLAADQTFSGKDLPEFRGRYRLTLEKPLSGYKVDPGEFYLKGSNEYLGIFYKSNADLEIRLVSLMGYEISKENKIEFGLDYRVNEFISNTASNQLWISVSWFTALDFLKTW